MDTILVTGGLGHIGSKLIRTLSKKYKIIVVDNLLTQRYCSLFNLPNPITFIDKCISELNQDDLMDVDVVIHLAAITNAAGSFKNKEQTENINLDLTYSFIKECDKAGCSFIFPSSTSVYGTAAKIVDEDNPSFLNPQSPYAETKIGIEKELKNYKSKSIVLRFGTIFGSSIGMRFHTAINKFCYQVSLGESLTIWKENFHQYRPYLGLNDAIDSILFILEKGVWGETYNVLTKNYKLSEILDIIKEVTPVEKINWVDTPLLNQFSYKVSDEKIKSLGWSSNDNIKKSITDTLSQLKNLNS